MSRALVLSARRTVGHLLVVLLLALAPRALGHDSAIAHVDRILGMWVLDGRIYVSYRLQQVESVALVELDGADTDGDGRVSDDERQRHFAGVARGLAAALSAELGGAALTLEPVGGVALDAGFGQTFLFSAALPTTKTKVGHLTDRSTRDRPGSLRVLQQPTGMPAGARAVAVAWADPGHERDHDHEHDHAAGAAAVPPGATAGADQDHDDDAGDHRLVTALCFTLPE